MGNIQGEESRLDLRKEDKSKLVYMRGFFFPLEYVLVLLCLSKKKNEGRNEENSTARRGS